MTTSPRPYDCRLQFRDDDGCGLPTTSKISPEPSEDAPMTVIDERLIVALHEAKEWEHADVDFLCSQLGLPTEGPHRAAITSFRMQTWNVACEAGFRAALLPSDMTREPTHEEMNTPFDVSQILDDTIRKIELAAAERPQPPARVKCGDCRYFVRAGKCGYLDTPEGRANVAAAPFWVWSEWFGDREQVTSTAESTCPAFAARDQQAGGGDG